jgi:hypothetical protein
VAAIDGMLSVHQEAMWHCRVRVLGCQFAQGFLGRSPEQAAGAWHKHEARSMHLNGRGRQPLGLHLPVPFAVFLFNHGRTGVAQLDSGISLSHSAG